MNPSFGTLPLTLSSDGSAALVLISSAYCGPANFGCPVMADYSFPKSIRLRRREEFRRAMDGGVKVVCPEMVVFAFTRSEHAKVEKAGAGDSRLGLVVSRRVGPAIVRNKVKRQLRESYRHLRPELESEGMLPSTDLVVIARSNAAKASAAQMRQALKRCLFRLEKKRQQDQPNEQFMTRLLET